MTSGNRWILAFNASCHQCRRLAEKVSRHGETRLGVMPLDHPEVRAWRQTALGENPPHLPTLIKVTEAGVHAWTGLAMAVRLAARLGFRGTSGLLAALGELRRSGGEGATGEGNSGRRHFLRVAGVGLAFSAIAGRALPASAAADAPSPADVWAQKNVAVLPREYEAFGSYDLEYRRAIFRVLSPQERSDLWVAHVRAFEAARPQLTADQRVVVNSVLEAFGDVSAFDRPLAEDAKQKHRSLAQKAIDVLGKEEAYALGANLGPLPVVEKSLTRPDITIMSVCDCATGDDWCSRWYGAEYVCSSRVSCNRLKESCGWGWGSDCNGECCIPTTQGPLCIT